MQAVVYYRVHLYVTICSGTPTNLTTEDSEPKAKVPKLKIPRIRLKKEVGVDGQEASYSLAVKPENRNTSATTKDGKVYKKEKDHNFDLKHDPLDAEVKKEPFLFQTNVLEDKAKNSSCGAANGSALNLNHFSKSSTSSAQFSPGSGATSTSLKFYVCVTKFLSCAQPIMISLLLAF